MKHHQTRTSGSEAAPLYKIEKNVALPVAQGRYKRTEKEIYRTLTKMEVSDSFELTPKDMKSLKYFRSEMSTWGKCNKRKLSVRKMADGKYRCFRLE